MLTASEEEGWDKRKFNKEENEHDKAIKKMFQGRMMSWRRRLAINWCNFSFSLSLKIKKCHHQGLSAMTVALKLFGDCWKFSNVIRNFKLTNFLIKTELMLLWVSVRCADRKRLKLSHCWKLELIERVTLAPLSYFELQQSSVECYQFISLPLFMLCMENSNIFTAAEHRQSVNVSGKVAKHTKCWCCCLHFIIHWNNKQRRFNIVYSSWKSFAYSQFVCWHWELIQSFIVQCYRKALLTLDSIQHMTARICSFLF